VVKPNVNLCCFIWCCVI